MPTVATVHVESPNGSHSAKPENGLKFMKLSKNNSAPCKSVITQPLREK